MTELLDIVDQDLRIVDRMDRAKAHRTCAPHRTFHCWVFDSSRKVVMFQRRGPRQDFPLKLDVTVGGHISSGETVEMASREIKEEIGINIPYSELFYMGRTTLTSIGDDFCIVEIAEVHCIDLYGRSVELKPDPSELSGIVEIPLEYILPVISGSVKSMECAFIPSEGGDLIMTQISMESFLQESRNYFMLACKTLTEYMNGDRERPELPLL